MTSSKLITLDDFSPQAAYGTSYMQMLEEAAASEKQRKTVLARRGSKFILPAIFLAYGTAARFNQLPVRQFDFDIDHEIRKRNPPDNTYPIDNYLELATPVLAYGLGFIPGIEAKHNFRDRTIIVATSFLVMEGLAYGLKETFPVVRPRGWDSRSFPSGHVSVAMTGAHLMFREYRDVSPWIGVAGYLMATATGAFRMINYAHWLSDVVMGAGIGLISVEAGYMMLPVWHSVFGIEDADRSFSAVPAFGPHGLGIAAVYRF
jgi:membrane-associated phospholipid phosphatase